MGQGINQSGWLSQAIYDLISVQISLWSVKNEDITFIDLRNVQVSAHTSAICRLLGYCCWSGQISLIGYSSPSPRTELLLTWVSTGCLGNTLSCDNHRLSLWQKGSSKASGGMSGLTCPVGCRIDYNDLHSPFSTVFPSSILQYQCCSGTLHVVQLGREITLLHSKCQKHWLFNLRLTADRNFFFFKYLCMYYKDI